MCALKRPFEGISPYDVGERVKDGAYNPIPSSFSQGIKSLV